MLNKWDLQKEAGSLEMLITAISNDLVREKNDESRRKSESVLLKEMEEALLELRQARGMTKFLLHALAGKKREASGKRARRRICH